MYIPTICIRRAADMQIKHRLNNLVIKYDPFSTGNLPVPKIEQNSLPQRHFKADFLQNVI